MLEYTSATHKYSLQAETGSATRKARPSIRSFEEWTGERSGHVTASGGEIEFTGGMEGGEEGKGRKK